MKHLPSVILLAGFLMLSPLRPTGSVLGQSSDYYELAQNLSRAQVYTSSAVIPGEDDGARVGISFRVPYALLYFVRSGDDEPGGTFRADLEVVVGVYRDGERVAQKIWQKEPQVQNYESAEAQYDDVEGSVWFRLAPGTYQYRLEVTDLISEQTARTSRRDINVPESGAAVISGAVLAGQIRMDGLRRTVEMYNLSGDMAYGKQAWMVVPIKLSSKLDPDSLQVLAELRRLDRERATWLMRKRRSQVVRPRVEDVVKDLPETGTLLQRDTLGWDHLLPVTAVEPGDSSPRTFTVQKGAAGRETNRYILFYDLNGEGLENDHFAFTVSVRSKKEEVARHTAVFASYWREKPFSLYDLDLAITHLSFMTKPDVVDRLDDGSDSERKRKFETFWEKRDPTPDTPYNELMAEYYRRVDYAADEFRTELKPVRAFDQGGGSVPDGLRSDRARIYIVHGPPASKERQNPRRGLVRERWNYKDGRTFIFEALSKFDPFRLVEKYIYAGR